MSQLPLLVAAIVIGASALLVWRGQTRNQEKKIRAFGSRSELSAAEFWKAYYEQAGVSLEVVEELLPVVAAASGVPANKIRPQDRFAHELAEAKGWEFDSGLAEIQWFAEARAKSISARVDLANVKTVDDFIRLLDSWKAKACEPRIETIG